MNPDPSSISTKFRLDILLYESYRMKSEPAELGSGMREVKSLLDEISPFRTRVEPRMMSSAFAGKMGSWDIEALFDPDGR
jgi:hypothetical protein